MSDQYYDQAVRIILAAIREAKEMGLDERATRAHIRNAYPFGERINAPYRAWLQAKRDIERTLTKLAQWNGRTN